MKSWRQMAAGERQQGKRCKRHLLPSLINFDYLSINWRKKFCRQMSTGKCQRKGGRVLLWKDKILFPSLYFLCKIEKKTCSLDLRGRSRILFCNRMIAIAVVKRYDIWVQFLRERNAYFFGLLMGSSSFDALPSSQEIWSVFAIHYYCYLIVCFWEREKSFAIPHLVWQKTSSVVKKIGLPVKTLYSKKCIAL